MLGVTQSAEGLPGACDAAQQPPRAALPLLKIDEMGSTRFRPPSTSAARSSSHQQLNVGHAKWVGNACSQHM
jgi:hypothetical protein